MNQPKATAPSGGAAPLIPLNLEEALRCRATGGPIRCPFEPIIGIPRPPVPPVILPLTEGEGLACFGGEAENPIKQLIDWVTGGNPRPDQWPPQIA